MKSKLFFLIIAALLFYGPAICQDGWSLKKDKNGIKVFTKKTKYFKVEEIKVECVLEGRISQLAAVLLDVSDHPEWVYKTKLARLLKTNSASDIYYYSEVECPWPIENRDVVAHMVISQNTINKTTTIETSNFDGYLPITKDLVRIKYSKIIWIATPINNKEFKVDYRIQVDPGGSLPGWVLNLFISKGPYESFMKLKERILLPKYANAKFPFIID